ncbi:MAG: MFS transporter [Microbacteriaceae bacterium]
MSTTLFAEPTRRVPARWIALFAAAWLGIWMAQLTPVQLLLPAQVEERLASDDWVRNVMAFGVISAVAGLCAVIAYPLTGLLSDRTTSRWGRRRPWILAGTLVFSASLVLLGLQSTMAGIGVFWSLALIGFCMLTAAVTATISDQVPVDQRGFVSGWVSAPQAVGTILGVLLVTVLALSTLVGYLLVAVLLLVLVLPFLLVVEDARLPREERPAITAADVVGGLWISPRRHPDFGWTLLGRILVNIGNALGTTLLLYFIEFGLDRADTAEDDLLQLILVYMVFFIASALVVGRLSDRIGRRKLFVYVAAYLQALAALLLALVPQFSVANLAAALLGLGYGSFMAVDQALATQVLPSARSRGKDLGIMNIATAVPQAVAPLLGALLVTGFAALATGGGATAPGGTFAGAQQGFAALFIASAAFAVLGGLAVIPIKGVR